jgi:hypothetical protein
MKMSTLRWLRCPTCQGRFDGTTGPTVGLQDYDILVCRCSQYPVVAGIPILKKGVIGGAQQTADELISLIRAGKHHDAWLRMTMPPPPTSPALAPTWVKKLPSVKGLNRLKARTHSRFIPR